MGCRGGRVVSNAVEGGRKSGRPATVLNSVETKKKFPFVELKEDEEAVFQKEAGYLNPRTLVT